MRALLFGAVTKRILTKNIHQKNHFSSISDIITTHSTPLTLLLLTPSAPMPRLIMNSPPSPPSQHNSNRMCGQTTCLSTQKVSASCRDSRAHPAHPSGAVNSCCTSKRSTGWGNVCGGYGGTAFLVPSYGAGELSAAVHKRPNTPSLFTQMLRE